MSGCLQKKSVKNCAIVKKEITFLKKEEDSIPKIHVIKEILIKGKKLSSCYHR